MSLIHGHSSSLGFGASFGHSCGRFVDHGGHGGRFFLDTFRCCANLGFCFGRIVKGRNKPKRLLM